MMNAIAIGFCQEPPTGLEKWQDGAVPSRPGPDRGEARGGDADLRDGAAVRRRSRARQYAWKTSLRRATPGDEDRGGVSVIGLHRKPDLHRTAGGRIVRLHSGRALA